MKIGEAEIEELTDAIMELVHMAASKGELKEERLRMALEDLFNAAVVAKRDVGKLEGGKSEVKGKEPAKAGAGGAGGVHPAMHRWYEVAKDLADEDGLNEWEREFLRSTLEQLERGKFLSTAQQRVYERMQEKHL